MAGEDYEVGPASEPRRCALCDGQRSPFLLVTLEHVDWRCPRTSHICDDCVKALGGAEVLAIVGDPPRLLSPEEVRAHITLLLANRRDGGRHGG